MRGLLAALLLLAAFPVRAEDALAARRREAGELARASKWDEAAAVYLEIATAKPPLWEADARNAQACAGRAAAERGETEAARAAFAVVLKEDPEQPIAKAGLAALEVPKPPSPPLSPPPPPAAEEPPPAAPGPGGDPEALCREALDLAREGKLLAARERLRQCLRLRPEHPGAWKAVAEVSKALVAQVERSFHRHDRPSPEPPLPGERPYLRRSEIARRDGHLPEDKR